MGPLARVEEPREPLHPLIGLQEHNVRRASFFLGLPADLRKDLRTVLRGLYDAFTASDADLAAIEKRMAEIAKRDLPIVRKVMPRDSAVQFFRGQGETYKAEIIASIPAGEQISLYEQGNFVDLCRGPHVPSSGRLKVFKLLRVAGAYWRREGHDE